MERKSVFISSVSRREVSRRRPSNYVLRQQLTLVAIVLVCGLAAYVAGRGV